MNRTKSLWAAFLAVFLVGAAVRAVDLDRPADGSIRESWRESDYAALARNFLREGMRIGSPRVDWRGDGPGLAEMELPVVPWLTASLYRVFGVHEALGRGVSYLFALLALLAFFGLARSLLPPDGAVFASAFFALAPLAIRVSNALQPESLMLFLYVFAVWGFKRWLDTSSPAWYAASLAATAGAVLSKAPAAHIGLLFVVLVVQARGWRGLFRPAVIAYGVLALLPAAAWAVHAHRFWIDYGNSLGLSNEYHWIGLDMIVHPGRLLKALAGMVRLEAVLAAMIPGLLLAPFALRRGRREAAGRMAWPWFAAIAAYFLLAARTAGDVWASYYHVVAVPPFALLFGLAFAGAAASARRPAALRAAAAASFAAGAGLVAARAVAGVEMPRPAFVLAGVLALAAAAALLFGLPRRPAEGGGAAKGLPIGAVLTAAALLALFPLEGAQAAADLHPTVHAGLYACAEAFRPLIPEGALILVSGGPKRDETGKPVAHNASYFFYWLDRKGFSLPEEDQSLDAVAAFVRRGASYFVLEDEIIKARPGFKDELGGVYVLLKDCGAASLFRLR